jgi:hypothetical protein
VPQRGTFWTGWGIAAVQQAAGIAKTHWHDGNAALIVECVAVHLQPGSQTVA